MEKKTNYAKMYKIHSSQKENKELHEVLLLDGFDFINDEISLLENYVLANGIKGKKWFDDEWNYPINHNYQYLKLCQCQHQ